MKHFYIILFFFGFYGWGQVSIPKDYFANPLAIEMILSGNFGELRPNHFHSGLDIKTQQREGLPVYASADGFVSRINVGHFGYGKALYIQHPNGYTTVYGHLQKYAGEIEEYVKKYQYQKEKYDVEMFPEKDMIAVKKGDLVAFSGNTGGSGGPHLHFEIRDGSQRPMNPMLFGLQVPDSKNPIIDALYAYPVGDSAHINERKERVPLRLIKQKDGTYKSEKVSAYDRIGFGIETQDQLDGAANKNGAYRIHTLLNNIPKFEVRFDKFSFGETRYLNRYIDYEHYQLRRRRIQKLFREENNPLSVIVNESDNGFIQVKDGHHYSYQIVVSDFSGNQSEIIVPVEGKKIDSLIIPPVNEEMEYVSSNKGFAFTKGLFNIFIPAGALYEDVYLDINEKNDTLQVHKNTVPLHKNMVITADISKYKEADRDKLYIGRLNYRNLPTYTSTKRQGDKITASTRDFGKFVIARDENPPLVTAINFSEGKWISDQRVLKVKIVDRESGISSYRATINGKFILMEYEYKKNTLTYDFSDKIISEAENNLKVVVIDNVGNSTTFETKFFRKPI